MQLSSAGTSLTAPGTPEVPRRRRVLHPRVPSVRPPPRAVQAQPPGDIFCLHSASFSAQEEVSVSGQVAQGCWQPRQPSGLEDAQGQGFNSVWGTELVLGCKEHPLGNAAKILLPSSRCQPELQAGSAPPRPGSVPSLELQLSPRVVSVWVYLISPVSFFCVAGEGFEQQSASLLLSLFPAKPCSVPRLWHSS